MFRLIFGFILVYFVAAMLPALAEEPHDTVRESLVFIRATGLSTQTGTQGKEVHATATGFLVSENGLILTNYHILEQLGEVSPKTIRFEISVRERTSDRRPAATVNGSEILDLLLLKTPPPAVPFTAASLGSALRHPDGDAIFTSGFPDAPSYRKQRGLIEAREGPGGVLWSINFGLRPGQSGSPVYDRDSKVIGVIKGDDESGSYMIPIDVADGLISQVRIRAIWERIEKLEDALDEVRTRIDNQ